MVGVCFSGGGINCCCFIGTLIAIEREGIDIDTYAGTSGGAIVSTFAALGANIETLRNMVSESLEYFENFDENSLKTKGCVLDFGPIIHDWFSKCIVKLGYKEDLTFEQWPSHCKRLIIHSFCVEDSEEITWDTDNSPKQLEVRDALYASCAVPFVFHALVREGKHFLDGGVSSNIFVLENSLVFTMTPKTIGKTALTYNEEDIITSCINLILSVLKCNIKKSLREKSCRHLIIPVPWEPLQFLNIEIDPGRIEELIDAGVYHTTEFFDKKHPINYVPGSTTISQYTIR